MKVQFVQKSQPYNSGEIADFSDAIARRLVSAGVAVPHMPKKGKDAAKEEIKEVTPAMDSKFIVTNRRMKAKVEK